MGMKEKREGSKKGGKDRCSVMAREHMYFPFLICEVKDGDQGLNIAHRQKYERQRKSLIANRQSRALMAGLPDSHHVYDE